MRVRSLSAAFGAVALLLIVEGFLLPTAWAPDEPATVRQTWGAPVDVTGTVASIYPLILRPVAGLFHGGALLDFGRIIDALLCAALIMPAYLLARHVAPPRIAAAAAVAAALAPAAVYGTAFLPDPLAWLLAAWAFALFAQTVTVLSPAFVGALACSVAAALVRPWFAVLAPALALARIRRISLAAFRPWPRVLALVLLVGLAITGAEGVSPELHRGLRDPGEVLRGALASLAAAAFAIGVIPWGVALARLERISDPLTRLLAVCAPALAIAAGVTAATGDTTGVDERPLVVLTPVVIALALGAWPPRLPSRRALLAGGAVCALAALALPRSTVNASEHNAPGLALAWSVLHGAGREAPLVLMLVACVLVVLTLRVRWEIAAATVGALIVLGHVFAWRDAHSASVREAAALPPPRAWLDDHVHAMAAVTMLSVALAPPAELRELALWNRSFARAESFDPATANAHTGALPVLVTTPYAIAKGIELDGATIGVGSVGTLIRLTLPARLAAVVQGLYADGWSGNHVLYRRLAGRAARGVMRIVVSRAAWGGPDVPGTVIVTVGGSEIARIVIHSKQTQTLTIHVPPPPFDVDVTVSPTFSPSQFGQGDTRQLGAQLSFEYPTSA